MQFDDEEAAQNAIDKLNGILINDKQVYVGCFLRWQERESALDKTKFSNVYVKNLSESTVDEDLKNIFWRIWDDHQCCGDEGWRRKIEMLWIC